MKGFREFQPDLIVEVTGVCDRACAGCYAPNVISPGLPLELYKTRPDLFLQPETFRKSLQSEALKGVRSIAFRGGEPSAHPFLYELLRIAHSLVDEVFVETHGRWIQNPLGYFGLMCESADLGTFLKLSYDRMHGLTSVDLMEITDKLDQKKIKWLIAITESAESIFLETRSKIKWIPDEKIIFQKKALTLNELLAPRVGIIKLNGNLSRTLSVRSDFFPKPALVGVGI